MHEIIFLVWKTRKSLVVCHYMRTLRDGGALKEYKISYTLSTLLTQNREMKICMQTHQKMKKIPSILYQTLNHEDWRLYKNLFQG